MKIDSEISKALLQVDENNVIGKDAPITKIVHSNRLDWEPEADIGRNRTTDILITINSKNYSPSEVAIEIENDREFDVEATLRKIKRQTRYPNVVIIPKEYQRFSYLFQKSGIPVWYWTATCRWICRHCKGITTSSSSLMPSRCQNCEKQGFLSWSEPENIKFEEADKNPPLITNDTQISISFGERPV